MPLRPRAALLLTCAVAVCLTALPASAAAWTMVSEHDGINFDQSSSVRAADGTLHVVYTDNVSSSNRGIRHRTLATSGALGTPADVVAGWGSTTSPDIELVAGVPHVFFGGLSTTSTGTGWSASLATGTWAVSPTPMTANNTVYPSSEVSSALDSTGTPWISWSSTFGVYTHAGFAQAGPEQAVGPAGCCGYGSNLARDAVSGDLWLAYYSNADNEGGQYVRKVAPVLEPAISLPRASSSSLSQSRRLALVSRAGGGVYSAYCDTYPSCEAIRLAGPGRTSLRLRLSAAQQPTVAESVWAAAAPSGRIWVSWANRSGVFAVRTNKAVTAWGPVQRIAGPAGTDTIWSTSGEGSLGFLDLFANITVGEGTRIWTKRFSPLLQVSPVSLRLGNRARTVTLRVTDAGDPVPGAKLKLRGTTVKANRRGFATFTVPAGTSPGSYKAVGTAPGYLAGLGKLKVARLR